MILAGETADETVTVTRAQQSSMAGLSLKVLRMGAAATLALLMLPFTVPLAGKPHGEWLQFFGRFHPLMVHLPIGLLILVPTLDIGARYRPALREASAFVLALTLPASLITLLLGYMLAYGAGDQGTVLNRHLWGAITLTALTLWCVLARLSPPFSQLSKAYPAFLGGALLALFWTAHQGGSLTHGGDYLTQYMPTGLKRLIGAAPATVVPPDAFYARQVHPIFDAKCLACHGESKVQGGLRLDTYDGLMRGGKDGAVVVAHNPERSMLIERITLPVSDHRFMPAEGKPPLTADEITLLKDWIREGASPTATHLASGAVAPIRMEDPPPIPVPDYSALMAEIRKMRQGQGAKLVQVSQNPSDGLVLQTVDVASSFGDAQLAGFEKYSPYIVEAELGRTAITDQALNTLAKFSRLRALHLEGTNIAGSDLARLAPLAQLRYINLSETKVTEAAVVPLKAMPSLKHIYLFDTPAQPQAKSETQRGSIGSKP